MLRTVRAGTPAAERALARFRSRLEIAAGRAGARRAVERILAAVRSEGDAAVARFTRRFDGCALAPRRFRVSARELAAARRGLDPAVRSALLLSIRRVHTFQEKLALPSGGELRGPGERLTLSAVPLRRAGLYVPGGTAAYPSSVVMNAVPALVAGVEEVVLATPPRRDGSVSPAVLAAAAELGLKEVWRLGGAQAIAAMAYGTKTLRPVDKIVGPGNLYVTLAKQLVWGRVDLDMPAGPSEICVVADDSARPAEVAADLLSQAEHDPLAGCVLVTPSRALAAATGRELRRQLAALPRRDAARRALADWGLVLLVGSLAETAGAVNELAPEHLELLCRRPERVAARVRSAGTVFIGRYSPEPVGDYLAGPSHTLPTSGAARAFSGLSAASFCRLMASVELSAGAFRRLAGPAAVLARAEGLEAHARAVESRLRR